MNASNLDQVTVTCKYMVNNQLVHLNVSDILLVEIADHTDCVMTPQKRRLAPLGSLSKTEACILSEAIDRVVFLEFVLF